MKESANLRENLVLKNKTKDSTFSQEVRLINKIIIKKYMPWVFSETFKTLCPFSITTLYFA